MLLANRYFAQMHDIKINQGLVYLCSYLNKDHRSVPNYRAFYAYLKAFKACGMSFGGYGTNDFKSHPLVCIDNSTFWFFNPLNGKYMNFNESKLFLERCKSRRMNGANELGTDKIPNGTWHVFDPRVDEGIYTGTGGDGKIPGFWNIHLFFGTSDHQKKPTKNRPINKASKQTETEIRTSKKLNDMLKVNQTLEKLGVRYYKNIFDTEFNQKLSIL